MCVYVCVCVRVCAVSLMDNDYTINDTLEKNHAFSTTNTWFLFFLVEYKIKTNINYNLPEVTVFEICEKK